MLGGMSMGPGTAPYPRVCRFAAAEELVWLVLLPLLLPLLLLLLGCWGAAAAKEYNDVEKLGGSDVDAFLVAISNRKQMFGETGKEI